VHIFKAKINRRFCGTVGFCEIHVCFFSVLSNETPEILLVRARDGAWTFFRSGYTPRLASAIDFTSLALLYDGYQPNESFNIVPWGSLQFSGKREVDMASKKVAYVWKSPSLLSLFFSSSVSFVRGPKWHIVDRRSLWNYKM